MKLGILMHNMAQIEQWLAVYTKSTPKDFSRMASVLDRYDHPELKTPAIHVTGTNGKGQPVVLSSKWRQITVTDPPIHVTTFGVHDRTYSPQ